MDMLEICVFYDGMLVYEFNWCGEKLVIGEIVFFGCFIVKILDMFVMQVKGFVFDKEVIDFVFGLFVLIILDVYFDQVFYGKVKEVVGFFCIIFCNNFIKYFEVIVSFDD